MLIWGGSLLLPETERYNWGSPSHLPEIGYTKLLQKVHGLVKSESHACISNPEAKPRAVGHGGDCMEQPPAVAWHAIDTPPRSFICHIKLAIGWRHPISHQYGQSFLWMHAALSASVASKELLPRT